MASTIDRNVPATNAPLESQPVRDNFGAAADDVEALQSGKANQTDLTNHTGAANPHSGSLSTAHEGAGGAVHADAIAGGASGFLSGADKTKLDALDPAQTGTLREVREDGSQVSDGDKILDFVGAGVGVAAAGGVTTVTIPGGSGGGGITAGTPFVVGDILEVQSDAGDGTARTTTNVARLDAENVFTGRIQEIAPTAGTSTTLLKVRGSTAGSNVALRLLPTIGTVDARAVSFASISGEFRISGVDDAETALDDYLTIDQPGGNVDVVKGTLSEKGEPVAKTSVINTFVTGQIINDPLGSAGFYFSDNGTRQHGLFSLTGGQFLISPVNAGGSQTFQGIGVDTNASVTVGTPTGGGLGTGTLNAGALHEDGKRALTLAGGRTIESGGGFAGTAKVETGNITPEPTGGQFRSYASGAHQVTAGSLTGQVMISAAAGVTMSYVGFDATVGTERTGAARQAIASVTPEAAILIHL